MSGQVLLEMSPSIGGSKKEGYCLIFRSIGLRNAPILPASWSGMMFLITLCCAAYSMCNLGNLS